MIRIKPTRSFQQVLKLVREWPDRTAALLSAVPRDVATKVLEEIRQDIPSGDNWKAYKQSLELAKATGLSEGEEAWVIRTRQKAKKIRRVDGKEVALYVRSHRPPKRPSEEVLVLARFSPWTLDTIPFFPKKSEAIMVSRKMTQREVQKIAKQRQKDASEWKLLLARLGIRDAGKRKKKTMPDARAVPDVAFEAIRLEFGLGDVRGKMHWRPALRRLRGSGFFGFAKNRRDWRRTMQDPWYREWGREASAPGIGASGLRDYERFQKMLGFRF